MKTVHIDSYLKYADGTNITPCVVKAIEELKANGGGTLVFDKKTYFFKESGSVKHVCNVSNNWDYPIWYILVLCTRVSAIRLAQHF